MANEFNFKNVEELLTLELFDLIIKKSPTKVRNRFLNSLLHYSKAKKLEGIDEEMGAIRLIAAEEELVVAIFEILKINSKYLPDHKDFIKKFKNHQVKLSFYPVLSVFSSIIQEMKLSITPTTHCRIDIDFNQIISDDKVSVEVKFHGEGKSFLFNPLDFSLYDENSSSSQESLYQDFENRVKHNNYKSIKDFITERADFRNKLLYSNDHSSWSMDETLRYLIDKIFINSLSDLILCLGILVTNKPTSKEWGLVNQFINLYRLVLIESSVINSQ